MRLPWKRHPKVPAAPRPNYTSIAVMENDLFGIQPKPGTAAAAIVGMRRIGECLTHQPLGIEGATATASAENCS
ncbi:hypothetical protein [Streptomyces angustmyceticus]|uniref:hypothetical protein n=1 Tax=Streptomyces angustmyceticus TaxID=285578 RepID=UPI00344D4417